jgi:hypothetical protein
MFYLTTWTGEFTMNIINKDTLGYINQQIRNSMVSFLEIIGDQTQPLVENKHSERRNIIHDFVGYLSRTDYEDSSGYRELLTTENGLILTDIQKTNEQTHYLIDEEFVVKNHYNEFGQILLQEFSNNISISYYYNKIGQLIKKDISFTLPLFLTL